MALSEASIGIQSPLMSKQSIRVGQAEDAFDCVLRSAVQSKKTLAETERRL